jgi:hypothetical protein
MNGINTTGWHSANDHLLVSHYSQNRCTTIPVVDWFKFREQPHARKRIRDNYLTHRNTVFNDGYTVVPSQEPWSREMSSLSRLNLEWEHKKTGSFDEFTHPAVGDYPHFRYPIPFPPSSGFIPEAGYWNSKISGVVQCATLMIGEPGPGGRNLFKLMAVGPVDSQPVQVGAVRLHDATRGGGKNPGITSVSTGTEREFIAISKGEYSPSMARNDIGVPRGYFDTWEHKERRRGGNLYKFYNVMLIVRKDGFAERQGLGRVGSSCWEALERKTEEIILG